MCLHLYIQKKACHAWTNGLRTFWGLKLITVEPSQDETVTWWQRWDCMTTNIEHWTSEQVAFSAWGNGEHFLSTIIERITLVCSTATITDENWWQNVDQVMSQLSAIAGWCLPRRSSNCFRWQAEKTDGSTLFGRQRRGGHQVATTSGCFLVSCGDASWRLSMVKDVRSWRRVVAGTDRHQIFTS